MAGDLGEEDKETLASLSTATHRRSKAHSYSHTPSPTTVTAHPRNLSLGDDSITTTSAPISGTSNNIPLPDFLASGVEGIFRAPIRAAVHPGRPTFLELRPHPLRETQNERFLRTIACTGAQLWAGQESGIRVWDLNQAYDPGLGTGGRARRGDEDAAPFYESGSTSPVMCLVVDSGSRLIWSGHKDGRIRSWRMDQDLDDDRPIKDGLSWQAYRGPVLSFISSSHGDIWTGSEGGVIKVWPWEAIDKSLSFSPEERHMAALLVERSAIDLRSQVMVNGICRISASDVKCLLSDSINGKVLAAGSISFSLWDARTRELLKVYNIEGQIENRVDMSTIQEQAVEDELSVKLVTKSKKDKSQGNSFLQKSRDAIKGAAGAVRRVAKGAGAFVEDIKKTEAVVQTPNGMIWTGCSNGLLLQWDGSGNQVQEFHHHSSSVQCFCTVGTRLWIGYASGMVQVLDLEGKVVAGWIAHTGPVINIVVGKGFVFSLAAHGGIRGWNIASPGPIDDILRTELAARELNYTRQENVRLLVGTWNVGQGRASHEALMTWIGHNVSDVGIVVVGLQEVEMGAGFLAVSAAKETVGLEGSAVGQWWQDRIGKALNEGSTFERVGSRQLAALLIAIWVRKTLRPHVGDLDAAVVACGLGRAIGNKGGVGLRIRVYDRIMCFVNCHLAAHLEAVNRRNADFDHIFRTMVFTKSTNLLNTAAGMVPYLYLCFCLVISTYLFWLLYSSGFPFVLSVAAGVSTSAHMTRGANQTGTDLEEGPIPKKKNPEEGSTHKKKNLQEGRPDLAEADLVLFTGDFNYRLFGISYDEARDLVSQRSFDWLREKDQLRAEMKAGRAFQGMREALIRFPPTYKFEKGKPGLGGYDSGVKKRIPAWCDRVIYRDNRVSSTSECSLECPVVTSVLQYEACMEVVESDHKPVRCKLNIDISRIERSVKRVECGNIMRSHDKIKALLQELCYVPKTLVNTDTINLQNQDASFFRITNKSGVDKAVFQITCEGQSTIRVDEQPSGYIPRGSFGFPHWLEVSPAGGVIEPDQVLEVSVCHVEVSDNCGEGVPQSWWNEDTRDKEVILVVRVEGSCSSESTRHRVSVRFHFSPNTALTESKNNTSKRFQATGSQRAGDK